MRVVHDVLIRQKKGPCYGACYYTEDEEEWRVIIYRGVKTPASVVADFQVNEGMTREELIALAEKRIQVIWERILERQKAEEHISKQAVLRICDWVINSNTSSKAVVIRKKVMKLPVIGGTEK